MPAVQLTAEGNQKVRFALDWIVVFLFPPDLVQLRVVHEAGIFRRHFEPGEVVFFQGDLGDSVYLIEKGECEVLREKDGKPEHIATLATGDYFAAPPCG